MCVCVPVIVDGVLKEDFSDTVIFQSTQNKEGRETSGPLGEGVFQAEEITSAKAPNKSNPVWLARSEQEEVW